MAKPLIGVIVTSGYMMHKVSSWPVRLDRPDTLRCVCDQGRSTYLRSKLIHFGISPYGPPFLTKAFDESSGAKAVKQYHRGHSIYLRFRNIYGVTVYWTVYWTAAVLQGLTKLQLPRSSAFRILSSIVLEETTRHVASEENMTGVEPAVDCFRFIYQHLKERPTLAIMPPMVEHARHRVLQV